MKLLIEANSVQINAVSPAALPSDKGKIFYLFIFSVGQYNCVLFLSSPFLPFLTAFCTSKNENMASSDCRRIVLSFLKESSKNILS